MDTELEDSFRMKTFFYDGFSFNWGGRRKKKKKTLGETQRELQCKRQNE